MTCSSHQVCSIRIRAPTKVLGTFPAGRAASMLCIYMKSSVPHNSFPAFHRTLKVSDLFRICPLINVCSFHCYKRRKITTSSLNFFFFFLKSRIHIRLKNDGRPAASATQADGPRSNTMSHLRGSELKPDKSDYKFPICVISKILPSGCIKASVPLRTAP